MRKLLLLFILCPVFFANAQVDLSKGLVAYYPFTGNANDVSGNDLNGEVAGSFLTTDRFGNQNAAYWFEGTLTSYIKVPDNDLLDFKGKFSFSLWYYKDTAQPESDFQGLFYKGRDVENSYGFVLTYNKETFYVRDFTERPSAAVDSPMSFLNWHHVVGVLDDSSNSLRLYMNGVLVHEESTTSFTSKNNYPLVFGRHFRNPDGFFTYEYAFRGKIDDARFYNRILNVPVENGQLYIENISNYQGITITDIAGRIVYVNNQTSTNSYLDLSSLKPGTYILNAFSGSEKFSNKVLIK